MGLSEVIFDLWEAKFDLWEASSRVWDPRSETQDPDFDLKEAKICGPETDFPSGGANFDLEGGQNPVDLANFWIQRSQNGQFLGSQPGKGSRVVAPEGIGSPFLDPEGSANPEGPKNASQI